MSTSSLSLLSAFLPQNPFLNPDFPQLKLYPLNSALHISCKSLHSQAQHKVKSSNDEGTDVLLPDSEDDGPGLASPSRGEVFLERQQHMAAIKKQKANKSKEKVQKVMKVLHGCYGCGASLQTSEVDAPGYVEPDTYELKKKHHQLRSILCGRCRLLSHGHMITAVGGNGGYPGGKQFVTAEELREKLANLRHEKALIVKLVDIVDFNGSFLSHIRDIVGANPIILVVTKVDLLPKGTDFNCIGDWVVEATTKKKLNVLSVHLTSSKSLVGITGVVSEIQKEKKGRNVYILGSANVGKSAFISALLNMLSYKDPAAASARRYKPIQSAVPGTTLGPIQIDAFLNGGKLYDTPGVHLHHRQAAVIHARDLPALAPQSRLRGQSFPNYQATPEPLMASGAQTQGLMGFSIFWGGLVRIDVIKALPKTSLTFYGPKALRIHLTPSEIADEFYQKEMGVLLTPPTGKERAAEWKGLETLRKLEIKYEDIKRPACDVAISGLGWICVEAVNNKSRRKEDDSVEEKEEEGSSGTILLSVHVPKPVEIFIRSPIPVGTDGAEWYEFRDLTDKEEEERPKWNF